MTVPFYPVIPLEQLLLRSDGRPQFAQEGQGPFAALPLLADAQRARRASISVYLFLIWTVWLTDADVLSVLSKKLTTRLP
jgi:hypothetical protein